MRVGDIITLTKEQFLTLAPKGLQVARTGALDSIFRYVTLAPDYSNTVYENYINGYIFYYSWNPDQYNPINGLWVFFDGITKFKVIQPPRTRISKTRALDS